MPVDHSPPRDPPRDGSTTTTGDQQDNEPLIQDIAVIKSRQITLPPFYKQNPRLWFAQIELAFANHNITSDTTKFRQLAAQLSGDVLDSVSDIILSPPRENKYETIKKRITTAYDKGDERRLRRLLRGNEIGEKPTAYLYRLKSLTTGQCSEPVLGSLFLEQLPDQVRTILAITGAQDVASLAEIADKAMDIIKPPILAISATGVTPDIKHKSEGESAQAKAIETLTLQVEALARKFEQKSHPRRAQSKSRGRQLANRLPAQTAKNPASRPCYFHRRFGTEARNCQEPCGWPKTQEKQEN
ncbi:PREDICTED: uncharacterized protein LOC105456630 [Wasmannia auropunctata]|uniref:uncharacterized protein LOC105456630 n=1 Tax=Wasmannia auropunctata TaxID=64793 RepID=UPI0005F09F23|nr:PREDICTED: uncharacterized protein LOC105456630 [Wasmannia auropunctata]